MSSNNTPATDHVIIKTETVSTVTQPAKVVKIRYDGNVYPGYYIRPSTRKGKHWVCVEITPEVLHAMRFSTEDIEP